MLSGCNEDEAARAFRQAASSSLQTGADALFDGLVDGAFAVFELGADQDSTGDATTSSGA